MSVQQLELSLLLPRADVACRHATPIAILFLLRLRCGQPPTLSPKWRVAHAPHSPPRRRTVGPSWRPPNGVVFAAIGAAEPILTKEKVPAARLCRLSIAWEHIQMRRYEFSPRLSPRCGSALRARQDAVRCAPRTTNIWDMSPAAVLAVGGPSMRDRRRTTHAAQPSRPRGRRASQATRPQAVARHSAPSTG